jgi:hypothetical protein
MGRKKEPTPSLDVDSIDEDTLMPGGSGADATEETPIDVATEEFSPIIKHIIELCGFSLDTAMVDYICQQQWEDLVDVTTIDIGDIKDFHVVRRNGTFNAKP